MPTMTDPILIIGAGPTGLTAALELSRFGIPVRLIDKALHVATTSRAIGVQARTLELLQQRGLAQKLIELGNPCPGARIYGNGKQLFSLDLSRLQSRYAYQLFVSQADTEAVLREAVEQSGVVIERGVELIALSQDALSKDPSPVRMILRHPDGHLEEVKAPWIISAEGAHSTVRTTLDLSFEGKSFRDQYLLGDVSVDGNLSNKDFHAFSSEHGLVALFPMGGQKFRVIANNPLNSAETGVAPSLEELQKIYDERSYIPACFHDLGWSSWFKINSRMVSQLKIGRLLLGGDAAHIHSPAGAQGMNTGIQDMINLCWKLAFVVSGKAQPSLLDTYETDRLPVIRNVLEKTEELSDVVESNNRILRLLVDHIGPFIAGIKKVQDTAALQMSELAVSYHDSPLSTSNTHSGELRTGDRMPDLVVNHQDNGDWKEVHLIDILDPSRFTLVVSQDNDETVTDSYIDVSMEGWHDLIQVVRIKAPADADTAFPYAHTIGRGDSFFLVRPDGYIGIIVGHRNAAKELTAYYKRWFIQNA